MCNFYYYIKLSKNYTGSCCTPQVTNYILPITFVWVDQDRFIVGSKAGMFLKYTELDVEFLAVLACLRNGDTSQAAGPFKERRVRVDGLTGVVKCSDVRDRRNRRVAIVRFQCAAWWSQNA